MFILGAGGIALHSKIFLQPLLLLAPLPLILINLYFYVFWRVMMNYYYICGLKGSLYRLVGIED